MICTVRRDLMRCDVYGQCLEKIAILKYITMATVKFCQMFRSRTSNDVQINDV